jgi:hypothetical protein
MRWMGLTALEGDEKCLKSLVKNHEVQRLFRFGEYCSKNCNPKFRIKHKFNFIIYPKIVYLTYETDLIRMHKAILEHPSVC